MAGMAAPWFPVLVGPGAAGPSRRPRSNRRNAAVAPLSDALTVRAISSRPSRMSRRSSGSIALVVPASTRSSIACAIVVCVSPHNQATVFASRAKQPGQCHADEARAALGSCAALVMTWDPLTEAFNWQPYRAPSAARLAARPLRQGEAWASQLWSDPRRTVLSHLPNENKTGT